MKKLIAIIVGLAAFAAFPQESQAFRGRVARVAARVAVRQVIRANVGHSAVVVANPHVVAFSPFVRFRTFAFATPFVPTVAVGAFAYPAPVAGFYPAYAAPAYAPPAVGPAPGPVTAAEDTGRPPVTIRERTITIP